MAALVIGGLLALPVITIIYLAATPAENIWPHLVATVLPGYIWQTALLLAGVGAITFVVGTAVAWLVTACSFPLRRVFQWASLMPMAMPGYIVAYTYVDLLSYAGPVQTWLRGLFGWKTPADYWFPEIRSMGGAIVVLSMVLYPYVFLTARASFIRQPGMQMEVARALGQTAWGAFRRVALPLARPAIAVGVSLALMECVNDIGAAGFFGVRTLTLGDLHHMALAGKSRRGGSDRGGDAGLRLRPAVDRTRGPAAAQLRHAHAPPARGRPRAAARCQGLDRLRRMPDPDHHRLHRARADPGEFRPPPPGSGGVGHPSSRPPRTRWCLPPPPRRLPSAWA